MSSDLLTEDFDEEVRTAVYDLRMVNKIICRVDKGLNLHHRCDLVKVAPACLAHLADEVH